MPGMMYRDFLRPPASGWTRFFGYTGVCCSMVLAAAHFF